MPLPASLSLFVPAHRLRFGLLALLLGVLCARRQPQLEAFAGQRVSGDPGGDQLGASSPPIRRKHRQSLRQRSMICWELFVVFLHKQQHSLNSALKIIQLPSFLPRY